MLTCVYIQSFQPPYHFIVLPRAFHSIFFHLIVFFIEKNVFTLVLKIAYSNTRTQAHSQVVVLLVVVLQVRKILLYSNITSKANYGLCVETGKTAAAMTNFSGFMKLTELLTAVIFGRFAAVFFLTDCISVHFESHRIKIQPERNGWKLCILLAWMTEWWQRDK